MKLEFLSPGPALLVSNEIKVLAVADLHLGIESDLDRHGLLLHSGHGDRHHHAAALASRSLLGRRLLGAAGEHEQAHCPDDAQSAEQTPLDSFMSNLRFHISDLRSGDHGIFHEY